MKNVIGYIRVSTEEALKTRLDEEDDDDEGEDEWPPEETPS